MGTAILVGQHGSAWHVAEVEISSAYRAFSREKVMGTLGVHIGLNAVNVTLKAMPIYNQSSDIDYNERFHWVGATQMKEDYIAALQKNAEKKATVLKSVCRDRQQSRKVQWYLA